MQKGCEAMVLRSKALEKDMDPSTKVSLYIAQLPDWSKDICNRLRKIIQNASPSLTEEWNWNGPLYTSENGKVLGFAAFIKTVSLVFYNGSAMKDSKEILSECPYDEYDRCVKFTEEDELDEKLLTKYVKESIKLDANGFMREEKPIEVPEVLSEALAEDKDAKKYFDGLAKSYKREFVVFVTTAKQEKTKMDRVAKVVNYCSEGKTLNEKYLGKAREERAKKTVKRGEPNHSEESEKEAEFKKVKKTTGRSKK